MPVDNPLTPPAAPTTPPAAPAAEAPPAWVPQLLGAIERHTNDVKDGVAQWSQKVVTAVRPGEAPRAPAGPVADADPLRELAAGRWDPIDQRVDARIKDLVAPYLGAQANGAATANEATARAAIDAKFGSGSYDKHFKSDVDAMFGDQIASRAIPDLFNKAVNLIQGQKFDTLATAQSEVAKAKAEAEAAAAAKARMNAPYLPGPGYVPIQANTLSDEERAQLTQIRNATGKAPSEEEAAKLRDLVMSKRIVRMDDLAGIFPPAK